MNRRPLAASASRLGVAISVRFGLPSTILTGTPEEKANAKRPNSPFKREWDVNPLTGANYVAMTMAHPTEKGERIIAAPISR